MKIHIVQKGDTLWEIAKKYNVDFDEVVQLNAHLASPEMIMPGMKIRIPANAKTIKKDEKKPEDKKVITKKEITQKEEVKSESPKKIEVPDLPKLPEEKAVTLPAFDGETEHYPTTMFPEMPVEQKKVKQKEVKKEYPQKQPQSVQQQPAYQMQDEYTHHYQPQMMPTYYYPVMMPQYAGCGCCGHQMNMPYYSYPMDPRQYYPNISEPYKQPQESDAKSNKEPQLYPSPAPGSEE